MSRPPCTVLLLPAAALSLLYAIGRKGRVRPTGTGSAIMQGVPTMGAFAATADLIAATSSKREKVRLLSTFLREATGADLVLATRYFSGTVFPVGDARTLEVGGIDADQLAGIWRRHADVGDVTGEVLRQHRPAGEPITLQDLDAAFSSMAGATGARAPAAALRDLLARASPDAARYIAKLISGEMRIGLREGLVEEAIAPPFDADAPAVAPA